MAFKVSRRAALVLSILWLLSGCSKQRLDDLRKTWRERTDQMDESFDELDARQTVILYFQTQWHAVAYEVLAERTREEFDGLPSGPEALFEWFADVEREARQVFFRRYGFYPPTPFPPREPLDIDSIDFSWRRVLAAVGEVKEWNEILDSTGLNSVADLPAYLESVAKTGAAEEEAQELARRYRLEIWAAREIREILKAFLPFEEQLADTEVPAFIDMRAFPVPRWLELMERFGLIRPRVAGPRVEWQLTSAGERLLREAPAQIRALSLHECGFRPNDWLPGPRKESGFTGIARVLDAGWEEGPTFDRDEEGGFGTGQWITVEIVEGVVHFNQPFFPGDVVAGIFSYGGDTAIRGRPAVGDLVGYIDPDEWVKLTIAEWNAFSWTDRQLDPEESFVFDLCATVANKVLQISPQERRDEVLNGLAASLESVEALRRRTEAIGYFERSGFPELAEILRSAWSESDAAPVVGRDGTEEALRAWATCNGLQIAIRAEGPANSSSLRSEPCSAALLIGLGPKHSEVPAR